MAANVGQVLQELADAVEAAGRQSVAMEQAKSQFEQRSAKLKAHYEAALAAEAATFDEAKAKSRDAQIAVERLQTQANEMIGGLLNPNPRVTVR